jgi:hypothetical protein
MPTVDDYEQVALWLGLGAWNEFDFDLPPVINTQHKHRVGLQFFQWEHCEYTEVHVVVDSRSVVNVHIHGSLGPRHEGVSWVAELGTCFDCQPVLFLSQQARYIVGVSDARVFACLCFEEGPAHRLEEAFARFGRALLQLEWSPQV